MLRWNLAVLVFLGGACSSAQPPAGPKYSPNPSKEAPTQCPSERKAAQEAREAALGAEVAETGDSVAKAVFAHALCEVEALEQMPAISAPSQDGVLESIRLRRQQANTAVNLFKEVASNGPAGWNTRGLVGQARAYLSLARTVESVVPPAELDARGQAEFRGELGDAVTTLEEQARSILESIDEASDEACAQKKRLNLSC